MTEPPAATRGTRSREAAGPRTERAATAASVTPWRKDIVVSLDAAPADPRLERLTPGEARRRLEHARSSRTAQLRALTANGQDTDHLTTAQAEAIRQVLKEIDDAFTRLDEGTYGTCLGCSEAVPVERLEILPHTSHCVPCRRRATATAV